MWPIIITSHRISDHQELWNLSHTWWKTYLMCSLYKSFHDLIYNPPPRMKAGEQRADTTRGDNELCNWAIWWWERGTAIFFFGGHCVFSYYNLSFLHVLKGVFFSLKICNPIKQAKLCAFIEMQCLKSVKLHWSCYRKQS